MVGEAWLVPVGGCQEGPLPDPLEGRARLGDEAKESVSHTSPRALSLRHQLTLAVRGGSGEGGRKERWPSLK